MTTRGNKGGAPAVGANGAAPSETEKISRKMAEKRAKNAKAAGAPDVRDLTDLEASMGRAILAEKQLMDEKKKVLQLQDQLLKLQQTNLQLRTATYNTEVDAKDKERTAFLKGLGVEDGDKADLSGGKLVITRGGQKA